MSTEDWKLQVSYKTSTGDMINIRGLCYADCCNATSVSAGEHDIPFIDVEYHRKHRATALLLANPAEHSYRYGSNTGFADEPTRPTQVQVGNQQQDRQALRDVGMSNAAGSRPMQASKLKATLDNKIFPF
jgi:hypothetical protein